MNYSNPDDFPTEYAHRMWLTPIILTPFLWPAFITNSPTVMAFLCIPLAIFNITLLLNVMPVWRRAAILTDDDEDEEAEDNDDDELAEERSNRIAAEIELFVNTEAAYLDSHLKLEQVVERCNFSRRYVSKVFTERFGGFSDYVKACVSTTSSIIKPSIPTPQTKVLQRPVASPPIKRISKQRNDCPKSSNPPLISYTFAPIYL